MHENRTLRLDSETREALCELSYGGQLGVGMNALELLPAEMTPEEIDSVGFQVSHRVETITPSRDGFSKGRKAETDVVATIGFAASIKGDVVTAESVMSHLKQNKLSVSSWIAVRLIRQHLKSA